MATLSPEEVEARLPLSRKTLQSMRDDDVGYWLHSYEVRPSEVVDQALAAHDLADAIADLRRHLAEAERAGELAGEQIVGLTTSLRLAERALASQQDKP